MNEIKTVSLGTGEAFQLRPGRFRRGPVVAGCIDRCVPLADRGVFVFGWLVDPASQVSGFRIEAAERGIEPFADGHEIARPDVAEGFPHLGTSPAVRPQEEHPGFALFLEGFDEVPTSVRTILELANGETRAFEIPVNETLEEVLGFARDAGWPLLASELPESAAELPNVWRDALFRLLWLTDDDSAHASEMSEYLRGTPNGNGRSSIEVNGEPPSEPAEAFGLVAEANGQADSEHEFDVEFEPLLDEEGQVLPSSPESSGGERLETITADQGEMDMIRASGLFDAERYVDQYPEVENLAISPLEHFCADGWRTGKNPNAGFEAIWYLNKNPDVREHGLNPLWHYIVQGEDEGRWPHPLFDPEFYRKRYAVPQGESPLADYLLKNRAEEWRDPIELFDVAFYMAQNPDVAEAGEDALSHFLSTGHREDQDPSPRFNTAYYREKYLAGDAEINPLIHFYESDAFFRPHTRPGPHDLDEGIAEQVRRSVNPGDGYEDFDPAIGADADPGVKAMALYLPQFHAIPENDEWWGKGFTEWRNVMRGLPRYAGHFQPRVPRDLGFYDLSDPQVLHKQTALARQAGIHSFCFHYYWFSGRRLLERPLDNFLADASIDFPFSVCWANENWTRRWDGMESEILLRQDYNPDDDESLVDDLQRYFADPRYLRIDGRPLLMIYRVDILPEPRATFERWRELWESRHGERPLIFLSQTFGIRDPSEYDLDGAMEFPPHKVTENPVDVDVRILDSSFEGRVLDYEQIVGQSLDEPAPDYPLIKTAVPSWDNDARKQGAGVVLNGATPERYERWLKGLIDYANRHPVYGENIVCINAWNEWAEAAYLEPDVHYGSAYLNATARAIFREDAHVDPPPTKSSVPAVPLASSGSAKSEAMRVLLVGHDAHPFGAQRNLLQMAKTIRNQFGCEVGFLLRAGGDLVEAYSELGDVRVTGDAGDEHGRFVDADPRRSGAARDAIEEFRADGYSVALANTTATGRLVPLLKDAGFRTVSLIHELPRLVEEYQLQEGMADIAQRSDHVVFAAEAVRDAFRCVNDIPAERVVVRPQGLYAPIPKRDGARQGVRDELGIPSGGRIVLNAGSGDFRKGIDIFMSVAKLAAGSDLHFVWVGQLNEDSARWLRADMAGELADRVHLVDQTDDVAPYFRAADVFFLSSREDPFPSVVLEAMEIGLPVLALSESGGIVDLVEEHGRLGDRNDLQGLLVALEELSSPDGDPQTKKEDRSQAIREGFAWGDYCFSLLQLLEPTLKKVSVAVPSYNYRDYLAERLESIFKQSYPVFETIVLDDCSADDSLAELQRIADETDREFRIVANDANSGSAFRQWAKASELAGGDFLWIAEADDLSQPTFLERLAPVLDPEDVAFAFSDSAQIDLGGAPIGASYGDYYRQAAGEAMDQDFEMAGREFVTTCLAERNLILNVSSVVWNRTVLAAELERSVDELLQYQLAGDWHLYVAAALAGRKVAFVAEPLNIHRRHEASVTGSLDKKRHIDEVARVHRTIAKSLSADRTMIERMEAYLRELELQFGLARDD